MAYMDIDLGRVDTDELIDALSNQYLDEREQQQLLRLIKTDESPKLQLFLKVMNRYSLLELEQLFNEPTIFYSDPIPKEQLKLAL